MSAKEARWLVLRGFGGVAQLKELHWEAWGMPWLESLWQDVRFSVQSLRRSPGFTLVGVCAVLAGAVTAAGYVPA